MIRIKDVKPLNGFNVLFTFTDNTSREIDLTPYLHGPIFEPIKNNLNLFRTLHIDPVASTVVWDNGADIDPDVLYKGLTPAWMEKESLAA
jgi:hypothetical protein